MERLLRIIQDKNVQPKNKKQVSPRGEASAKSLLAGLDRTLLKRTEKEFRKISGFHPSYGYDCKRRWVLLFRGAESEPTFQARTMRIFDMGHSVHERWRDYFSSMGVLIEPEVEVKTDDPVPIRGHADGIIEWGGKKLYELKSISPTRYEFRVAYNKPDERTYKQAQQYLFALDMEDGFVIYENKGTQEVLIFPIEKDEEMIQKILRRYKKIYDIYEADEIPARPYKIDSPQCGDCDLFNYCWNVLEE